LCISTTITTSARVKDEAAIANVSPTSFTTTEKGPYDGRSQRYSNDELTADERGYGYWYGYGMTSASLEVVTKIPW
jgi:mannitol-1-phosphate/altronate dehydrogenase